MPAHVKKYKSADNFGKVLDWNPVKESRSLSTEKSEKFGVKPWPLPLDTNNLNHVEYLRSCSSDSDNWGEACHMSRKYSAHDCPPRKTPQPYVSSCAEVTQNGNEKTTFQVQDTCEVQSETLADVASETNTELFSGSDESERVLFSSATLKNMTSRDNATDSTCTCNTSCVIS